MYSRGNNYQVFFDFDNTLTHFDVLDSIIERFSINRDWVALEEAWRKGEIGSHECLKGQLALVRITKSGLLRYLSRIKIDPYFSKLLSLLRKRGIKSVIVSDNFSFIIRQILQNNKITGIKIYSNTLKFKKNRLIPSFPYTNKDCLKACGHCKKNNLSKNRLNNKINVYIGDGLSDVCPAQYCDIVFAKGNLLKYFKNIKRSCIPFKNLGDVYLYFKKII